MYMDSPMIFACDEQTCTWVQTKLFEQQLDCRTGVCIDDQTPKSPNIASFVILFAFAVLLLSIIGKILKINHH